MTQKMARVAINAKGYLGLRGTIVGMKMTVTGPVMLVTLDAKQGHPVRTIGFVAWMLTVEKESNNVQSSQSGDIRRTE